MKIYKSFTRKNNIICVRNKRKDGYYPVYIRVTHKREIAYIKTDKMVTEKGLTKTKEVKEVYVLSGLAQLMIGYMDKLNRKDIEKWSAKEIVDFLLKEEQGISFSEYAKSYVEQRISKKMSGVANYRAAIKSIEGFANTQNLGFDEMTTNFIEQWIKSQENTKRAKEMYPICVRQIFKEGGKRV